MSSVSYLDQETVLQGGKYRIVRFLGAGGFGCSYEAIYETTQQKVAIKEFFPHELCNRDSFGCMSVGTDSQVPFVNKLRKKFIDEANTLFHFNHIEKIVTVTDIFDENGTSYFVMDYIEGSSLQKFINQNKQLTEENALRIIDEVGNALECVHKHNFLHLDIKPDNIMMRPDGHIVLIDFGISKHYDNEDGLNKSTLMGCTPGFAPLEQMNANVSSFTPATDVYALGATLYAMLTGSTPPYATELLNETASLSLPDEISQNTRYAIKSAMQSRVKDRPQSVREFLHILKGGDSNTIFLKRRKNTNRKMIGVLSTALLCMFGGFLIFIQINNKHIIEEENVTEIAGQFDVEEIFYTDSVDDTNNTTSPPIASEHIEETHVLSQEVKVEEPAEEKTPAEKFEIATKNNDIDLLIELGNNNYSKAYLPLANHFLVLNTPSADTEADKWAKKAMESHPTEAQSIINELEKRGLYD